MSAQPLKLVEAGSLRPLNLLRIDIEVQCDAFLSRTATCKLSDVEGPPKLAFSAFCQPRFNTKATMVWQNPYDSKFEAELSFPLPDGGAVCGYAVDIDGTLVPGVVVTKEKARATFEAEVRKDRGGPAIIEQNVGNLFTTRINPFLPNGSRTIQVLFTHDLASHADHPSNTINTYVLPFLTPSSASCFATINISVPGNFNPSITSPHTFLDDRTDLAPQWRKQKSDQIGKYFYTFSGVCQTWSLASPFIFTCKGSNEDSSIVIDHCGPNTLSIAAAIGNIPTSPQNTSFSSSSWSSTKIGVLWDTSKSRGTFDASRTLELDAVEAICRHFDSKTSENIEMDLFTFNMNPSASPRHYYSKHLIDLVTALRSSDGITYHGGTNYSNLNQLVGVGLGALGTLFSSYQFWIVVTDGISNFGGQELPDLQAPTYILSAATVGDPAFLRRWARSSNGKFFNLQSTSHTDIIRGFSDTSTSFLYATLGGYKLVTESLPVDLRETEVDALRNRIMIVPSGPKTVDTSKLRFYARLDFTHPKLAEVLEKPGETSSSTVTLTVHFGVSATAQVTHTHHYELDLKQVLAMGVPKPVAISERSWAHGRLLELQEMMDLLGKNTESVEKTQLEKEQLSLSRHFTIVTPNTSLIVLETLQQFLDHMICPPMALPEIYKQYNKRIAARVAEEESKKADKMSRVHAWWQRRQKWADMNDLAHQREHKDPLTGVDEYEIAYRTHGTSIKDFKANRQVFHHTEYGMEEMNDLPITSRDQHNQLWHMAMPDAKKWPGMSYERASLIGGGQSPEPQNPTSDASWDVFFPRSTLLIESRMSDGERSKGKSNAISGAGASKWTSRRLVLERSDELGLGTSGSRGKEESQNDRISQLLSKRLNDGLYSTVEETSNETPIFEQFFGGQPRHVRAPIPETVPMLNEPIEGATDASEESCMLIDSIDAIPTNDIRYEEADDEDGDDSGFLFADDSDGVAVGAFQAPLGTSISKPPETTSYEVKKTLTGKQKFNPIEKPMARPASVESDVKDAKRKKKKEEAAPERQERRAEMSSKNIASFDLDMRTEAIPCNETLLSESMAGDSFDDFSYKPSIDDVRDIVLPSVLPLPSPVVAQNEDKSSVFTKSRLKSKPALQESSLPKEPPKVATRARSSRVSQKSYESAMPPPPPPAQAAPQGSSPNFAMAPPLAPSAAAPLSRFSSYQSARESLAKASSPAPLARMADEMPSKNVSVVRGQALQVEELGKLDTDLGELDRSFREIMQRAREIEEELSDTSSMLASVDSHLAESSVRAESGATELAKAEQYRKSSVVGSIGGFFSKLGKKMELGRDHSYSMLDYSEQNLDSEPTNSRSGGYSAAPSASSSSPYPSTIPTLGYNSEPMAGGRVARESYGSGGGGSCISGGENIPTTEQATGRRRSKRLADRKEAEIEDLELILSQNIDKVLSRGEKIEDLRHSSMDMDIVSTQFRRAAFGLKQKNNVQFIIFIGLWMALGVSGILLAYFYAFSYLLSALRLLNFNFTDSITSAVTACFRGIFWLGSFPFISAWDVTMHPSAHDWSWLQIPFHLLTIAAAYFFVMSSNLMGDILARKRTEWIVYFVPLICTVGFIAPWYGQTHAWDNFFVNFIYWFTYWVCWFKICETLRVRTVRDFLKSGLPPFLSNLFIAIMLGISGSHHSSLLLPALLSISLSTMMVSFKSLRELVSIAPWATLKTYGVFGTVYYLISSATLGLVAVACLLLYGFALDEPALKQKLGAIALSETARRRLAVYFAFVGIVAVVIYTIYQLVLLLLTFVSVADLVTAIAAVSLGVILWLAKPKTSYIEFEQNIPSKANTNIITVPLVAKEVPMNLEKPIRAEVKPAPEFSAFTDVDYSALPVANSPMMNQYDLVQFERPRFAFIDATPEGSGMRLLNYITIFAPQLENGFKFNASMCSDKFEDAQTRYNNFISTSWSPEETSHISKLFDIAADAVQPVHLMARYLPEETALTRESKKSQLALTALSNLAEGHLGKVQLLRAIAYKLEEVGLLEEALHMYRRILDLRGEEPQSYRDLALVLAQLKKYDECVALYDKILTRCKPDWDPRFSQIELVALTDLCGILPMMNQLEVTSGFKIPYAVVPAAATPIQVDLRTVLTWDVDGLDLELQVLEPNGESLNSFQNSSLNGGMLSKEFTGGYGPVEYLAKRALPGRYCFRAKVRSPCTKPVLGGQATIRFTVYTNFGLPQQTTKTHVIRVTPKLGQVIPLASVQASLQNSRV